MSVPTEINAGSYTSYAKLVSDSNHKGDIASYSISTSIAKKAISISVSLSNWTYGATANNPSVTGNSGGGTVTYYYKVSGAADSTYTTTKPSNAGNYVVKAVVAETSNYLGNSTTNTFSIAKAAPTYTAPTATSPTYSGSAQNLLNAGSTSHGTIQYSTNGSSWSTSIPQQTTAGTYTSYWKLVGDSNHSDIASTSISTTIAQSTGTASITGLTVTYNRSSQNIVSVSGNTGTMHYRIGTSGS